MILCFGQREIPSKNKMVVKHLNTYNTVFRWNRDRLSIPSKMIMNTSASKWNKLPNTSTLLSAGMVQNCGGELMTCQNQFFSIQI